MSTWYTPEEVAAKIKANEATVRRWLREGRMRGSYIGRVWRVSEEAIDEFMRAHERPAFGPVLPANAAGDEAQGSSNV